MSEPPPVHHRVVIVGRHHSGDPLPPGLTGIGQCGHCHHDVALIGNESTKVAAGTWVPLCEECGAKLADEHPDMFVPENFLGHSQDL